MENQNKEMQEKVKDFIDKDQMLKLEEMIINNCLVFEVGNKKYRINKPNIKQRQIVEKELFKLTNQLMSEGFLFEKQWQDKLKETQGVDLDDYRNKIALITKQIEAEYEILAPMANEEARKQIIFKIEQLKNERAGLHIELTDKRAPSIDSQIMNKSVYIYAYLLTEVEIEKDEYQKVWNTLEEFETERDDELLSEVIKLIMNYAF